ncbi:AraC family transcriptional regulator [Comamonas testosteroni]|uniref:AraC family transcriptional regulator n=1 Tax=Comamonas testosteroni TaxID=285 RepID=A0A0L7MC14_COMTE|nr:helix-turn-helix transcriptional regulator [Comamonas testosteroni]KOC19434.1 AraC family transcriptional regulator [Comamonas testosteroni]KWT73858.1 Transcriptional regulator, AraC family [Comamonas testosteroni]MDN5502685.1 helix-turn-helix transcriptional regulator [Comamonas sp.]
MSSLHDPEPLRAGKASAYVETLTPHLYIPTAQRPVRAKCRWLEADTQVRPHRHPWGQLAISTTGTIRLTVAQGTYIVPPSRVLWVPPGMEHAVTMVESADLRTLYFFQPHGHCGPDVSPEEEAAWRQCRVLNASDLLRAVVRELPTLPDDSLQLCEQDRAREHHLSQLLLDELRRASAVQLGVNLPQDKRLRQLCEAVLADPTRNETLEDWARDTGASPRTVARLFRQQLECSFTQWRQQVVLAHAVSLAARNWPIQRIAAELDYSPSAFSAMVRRTVGMPPAQFFGMHTKVMAASD